MGLLNDMAADAGKQDVQNDKLQQLSALVKKMSAAEKEVAAAEKELKAKKLDLANISEVQIPDLFDSLGLSLLKLETGEKVEVERGYAANISAERAAAAHKWLNDNGHGSIIKHEVVTSIKKGEEDAYTKLVELLNDVGVTYQDKESVHPQTLKSFVKEQMAKPESTLPQTVFGVFPLRKTKIS